ncbi:MAG: hypothetical protein IJ758_02215 [Clostridia bacterium]|nr:hypothetical protein [Clostridia bacterium]
MKELNKDKLKNVAGAEGWRPAKGDGKSYYLTNAAHSQLLSLGYSIRPGGAFLYDASLAAHGMMPYNVYDADGNGVGDELMKDIFGDPTLKF